MKLKLFEVIYTVCVYFFPITSDWCIIRKHLLFRFVASPLTLTGSWKQEHFRGEHCILIVFRDCLSFSFFFLPSRNPPPQSELLDAALLQRLPWANTLPPGLRRAIMLLHWQETCTICSVVCEALLNPVTITTFNTPVVKARVIFKSPTETTLRSRTRPSRSRGADNASFYAYWIYCFFKNNEPVNTNYRKPLWQCTHHEEGIQHLTLGQLKPQLGLIKQERTVPQVPRWNLADGRSLWLKHTKFISLLFLQPSIDQVLI